MSAPEQSNPPQQPNPPPQQSNPPPQPEPEFYNYHPPSEGPEYRDGYKPIQIINPSDEPPKGLNK